MTERLIASLRVSVLFAVLGVSSASAQVQRTFVSGLGNDSNSCARTAPCRTISHALMGTSTGGEVVVLDSAGYGAFVIGQSVSVTAPPGVYAGISVFSGDGIDINAGISDTVILRGLTINNQGSNGNGINFTSGETLHVEGCVVNGFSSGNGINFVAGANLEVKDSILRANSGGILVLPMAGTAKATIDQVRLENGGTGLLARDGSTVTVRNSLASGNVIGFAAESGSASAAELDIENCAASNNGTGILASSNSTGVATVRVSNSTVTDNQTGLDNAAGPAVILSRGNNTVEGNIPNNTQGTIGSYTAK
jgi:hypothetical protein